MPAVVVASIALALSLGIADAPDQPAAVDKRFCRALEVTGSIMSTKVCRTRAEWAKFDAERQKALDTRRTSNTIDRSQGRQGVDLMSQ